MWKDNFINVLGFFVIDFFFPAESTDPFRSACLRLRQLFFTTHTAPVDLSKVPGIPRELSDSFILWAWRCWLSSAETILNCCSSLHPVYLLRRKNPSVFSPVQSLASFLGTPASTQVLTIHTCRRVNSSYNLSVGLCIPSLYILRDGDFLIWILWLYRS